MTEPDWNPSDPIRCWLSTSDNLDIYQGVTHYTLHCPGEAFECNNALIMLIYLIVSKEV